MELVREIKVTLRVTVEDVDVAAKHMKVTPESLEENLALRLNEVADALVEDYAEGRETHHGFIIDVEAERI